MQPFRAYFQDVLAGLKGFFSHVFPYRRFFLTLLIGVLGGWAFARMNLPLPWMLGPMLTCTIAAVAGVRVVTPGVVRPPMTAIIGVTLGSYFTPEVLGHVGLWLPTLAGLAVFLVVCALLCVTYFRRVGGFDHATAYFAGMPGGLAEMVLLGEQRGADVRKIALVHATRVLLIIFTLPFIVQWLGDVSLGQRSRDALSIVDVPTVNLLWLAGTAAVGTLLGHVLRLPARYLLGPMVASAIVHGMGWSDFKLPYQAVNAAQLILGTAIGGRFIGVSPREIGRIILLTGGSIVILLSVTFVFGYLVSLVSTYEAIPLILAYSPGGLAEMSLVALSLQIEVAFVATHHIIRVLLVIAGADLAFRWFKRHDRKRAAKSHRP